MSQLKTSFIQTIAKALDESVFTKHDFIIALPKTGKTLIKLTFSHKPEYVLECSESMIEDSFALTQPFLMPSKKRTYHSLDVVFAPGEYKLKEYLMLSKLGDLPRIISRWCSYIKEDLYALAPTVDPLQELRAKFKEDIAGALDDPEGFFTPAEVEIIADRINVLAKTIEARQEDASISKQHMEEICGSFEEFKKNTSVYSKCIWSRVTYNRLIQILGQFAQPTKERKIILDQAIRFINETVAHKSLPHKVSKHSALAKV